MLKNIKTIKCPICGCSEIIKEEVEISNFAEPSINQHCNGTRWEHRKFLCGYEVNYIPNYCKKFQNEHSECFYDQDVIARKNKEKEDKESLLKILKDNNINQNMINKITMYCL